MEIEMKAAITKKQAENIINGKLGKNWKISHGGGWEALYKVDGYYSFNGIEPKNPKTIIRLRSESELIDSVSFDDIINFNINENSLINIHSYLATKVKNIDKFGTESNEEYEGIINGEAITAFLITMEEANFKPYFKKRKTSS